MILLFYAVKVKIAQFTNVFGSGHLTAFSLHTLALYLSANSTDFENSGGFNQEKSRQSHLNCRLRALFYSYGHTACKSSVIILQGMDQYVPMYVRSEWNPKYIFTIKHLHSKMSGCEPLRVQHLTDGVHWKPAVSPGQLSTLHFRIKLLV